MPTALENLQTRRDAICVELAAMSPTESGGQPTYAIEGQSVQHTEYRLSLYKELAEIDKIIATIDGKFDYTSEAL
jgi:hypothetical protein